MAPRSNPEAGSSRRATSMPTAGSSEASQGDSLAEESVVKVCKQCMLSSSGDEVVCPSCGSPLVPIRSVQESYVGETIDETYRLVREIGSGGMGTVYLGVDDRRDEKVAVKFLAKKYAANEQIIMRFLNEARSYGRVTHPNAVTLKEYGQHDDGALYLITEFVDGEPLSQAVQGAGPLTPGSAISVAGQVCGVLSAAHREGVIHRDLKPDNIMLVEDADGHYHAKVLDFGIAKIVDDERGTLTQTGAVFGTPEFMSPEQARGDVADERADIYAMGLILFYACTGVRPFDSQNQYKLLDMQQHQPPPRPSDVSEKIDVPAPLERVILTCLEKDPDDRYDSAIDLRVELERLAERLNTGPVTVDESKGQSTDPANVSSPASRAPGASDSDGEDTLFLRPFELARRAGVDSVEDSSKNASPHRRDDLDSVTYAEPGIEGEFRTDGDPSRGARREPGGSLETDLRAAGEDTSQTPHSLESGGHSLSSGGGATVVAWTRRAIHTIGASIRDLIERVGERSRNDDEPRWAVESAPAWGNVDALDSQDETSGSASTGVWQRGRRALAGGYVPAVVLLCGIALGGTWWGWSQMSGGGDSGAPSSIEAASVAAADEESDDESNKPLNEAKKAIRAGDLAGAETKLKALGDTESGDTNQAISQKQRRSLLRRIGRIRRLESSLQRSLDDRACGRARRTLQAIGETAPGLKSELKPKVSECQAMVPTPDPTEESPEPAQQASGKVEGEASPERQAQKPDETQAPAASEQDSTDGGAKKPDEKHATGGASDKQGGRAAVDKPASEPPSEEPASSSDQSDQSDQPNRSDQESESTRDKTKRSNRETESQPPQSDKSDESNPSSAGGDSGEPTGGSADRKDETSADSDEQQEAASDEPEKSDGDMALPPKQM